jgi:aprataxin
LGVYIESPETNPENKVLEYDDDFVVITDKYPKARCVCELSHS